MVKIWLFLISYNESGHSAWYDPDQSGHYSIFMNLVTLNSVGIVKTSGFSGLFIEAGHPDDLRCISLIFVVTLTCVVKT